VVAVRAARRAAAASMAVRSFLVARIVVWSPCLVLRVKK